MNDKCLASVMAHYSLRRFIHPEVNLFVFYPFRVSTSLYYELMEILLLDHKQILTLIPNASNMLQLGVLK